MNSLLNLDYLKELKEGTFGPEGENDFKDLLRLYIDEAGKKMDKISEAFDTMDRESLARLIHGLKGSSANVGAENMAMVCKEIESVLKSESGSEADLKAHFEQLKQRFEQTQQEMRQQFAL